MTAQTGQSQQVHALYRCAHGLTADQEAILSRGAFGIFATANPDGSPHLAPVMYLYEEGALHIETSSATRKAKNAQTTGVASVLVLDPAQQDTAWLRATGPIRISRGRAAKNLGRRIRARYFTALGEREVGSVLAGFDDIVISVLPSAWTSWDMTALNETLAAHGVSFDRAEDWYRSPPGS